MTSETFTETYYKIRFPMDLNGKPLQANVYGEWHQSNNGTDQWPTLAKIKAIITRGIQQGYKGRLITPFEHYEVVKFVKSGQITSETINL